MKDEIVPQLAAICYPRGFDIDRLLADVCSDLTSASVRLGGLLQVITGKRTVGCAASVRLFDLKTQECFEIWEDRGACASGCRLDERVLADAERVLSSAIDETVDLLIINRFGRAESLGRGLRSSFAAAVSAGIPVLTAVRAPYDSSWREYHYGVGVDLPCDRALISDWALETIGRAEQPRPLDALSSEGEQESTGARPVAFAR
jgi:hypothetical protein